MSKVKIPLDPRTLRWASRRAIRQMRLCFGDSRPEYRHLDLLAEDFLNIAKKLEIKNNA